MLEFSIITIGSFVTMLDSITRYIGKFCFKKDIDRVEVKLLNKNGWIYAQAESQL